MGGTYTGRYNSLSEGTDVDPFNYSPEVRSSVLYDFRKDKIQVALFYKYSGKVIGYYQDGDNNIQESMLSDFHTMDITGSKSLFRNRVKWTLGVKNIFNIQDLQSTSSGGAHSSGSGTVPMSWGTSVFTSLGINVYGDLTKKSKHDK